MEVSFAKDPVANPATPVIEVQSTVVPTPAPGVTVETTTTAAAVPAAPVSVPAVVPPNNNALILGDSMPNFSEMIIPRVNIVQFSGVLKDSFEPGTVLFNQQVPLQIAAKINDKDQTVTRQATAPVTMTFCGFWPTRYVEKVPGGGKGALVNTEAQVTALGGTLDYNEWLLKREKGMKRFEYYKQALVVIERPEIVADDDTIFTFEVDGKKYTIALWALKGSAYTQGYKKILAFERRMGCLRIGGFPSTSFSVSARIAVTAGNKYFVPFMQPRAKSTPAMLDFIKELVTGTPTTTNGDAAAAAVDDTE
jgi:hypothetical protein